MPKFDGKRKYCSVCSKPKTLDNFYKAQNNKTGYEGKCKACRDVSSRDKHLKRRYGVSEEDYYNMLEQQGGVCKICSKFELRSKSKYMVVDHCHDTGTVRGVLCHKCNTALGLFNDDVETMKKAINYLEEK